MVATNSRSKIEEQRDALSLLTTLLVLQAALVERIQLLIENRDDPAVDVEAWDRLIGKAKVQRDRNAGRIETLRKKLGFDHPHRLH